VTGRRLQIVVCGAGPAADVTKLISIAQSRGWAATVAATTAALDFVDVARIEEVSGYPVRTGHQATASARRILSTVDALIIAPATFNTVNKLAAGIADTYVLTSVAELIGRGVPTVVVPFVNSALASRAPFERSVAVLRSERIQVHHGPDHLWEPHPPGTGADKQTVFPWEQAFNLVGRMVDAAAP
jgi:phosphopantothenoylcysteine synthetase/decarboxylase